MSLMHLAVGSKGSSVGPRSLPSTANATDSKLSKSCSADRSRYSVVALSVFQPSFTSTKIAACPFCHQFHLITIKDERVLWNQFLRGQTGHCLCLNDIPVSHSRQATSFHLLVCCQPLPSRSHGHRCFPRITEK